MRNKVEVGSHGRLGDLNIGDRFDFLKKSAQVRSSLALVKEIIPPHQPSDPPDLERTVSIEFFYVPGLEINISGMTTVRNFGKAPSRRITLAEERPVQITPKVEFPGSTGIVNNSLGKARSPIILGVNF